MADDMQRLARSVRAPGRSISEDEVMLGGSPIDELRRTVNTRHFTPEQAAANREALGWEVLSVLPGPGNVISAYDAYNSVGDAAEDFEGGDYKGTAIHGGLAGLSALGAVLGLPVGKYAKGAAEAGKDSLFAIPAWHGSPHDFDEFKLDKIGTGEGAQVYGHGLYFAEKPEVARNYRDVLSDFDISHSPEDFTNAARAAAPNLPTKSVHEIANYIQHNITSGRRPVSELRAEVDGLNATDDYKRAYNAALDIAERANVTSKGKLYHTELDVEPEDLLDWDLPLSQQSEKVRAALAEIGIDEDTVRPYPRLDSPITGERILQQLQANKHIGPDEATALLREAGIPGIRYLDQGSRAAGEGSRNFVIFDDSLVKILGKE